MVDGVDNLSRVGITDRVGGERIASQIHRPRREVELAVILRVRDRLSDGRHTNRYQAVVDLLDQRFATFGRRAERRPLADDALGRLGKLLDLAGLLQADHECLRQGPGASHPVHLQWRISLLEARDRLNGRLVNHTCGCCPYPRLDLRNDLGRVSLRLPRVEPCGLGDLLIGERADVDCDLALDMGNQFRYCRVAGTPLKFEDRLPAIFSSGSPAGYGELSAARREAGRDRLLKSLP